MLKCQQESLVNFNVIVLSSTTLFQKKREKKTIKGITELYTVPQSAMMTSLLVFPLWEPTASIFLTVSKPSTTLPNTTCFPSSLKMKVKGETISVKINRYELTLFLQQRGKKLPPCSNTFNMQFKLVLLLLEEHMAATLLLWFV